MKKGFQYYVIVWAVLLAAFNIIVFITPGEAAGLSKFGGAFWPGYIFITLSFIGQLLCAFFAFKSRNAKKLFLNLPLITISYPALIVSVIVGMICMAVPNLPVWAGIVICLLILGFFAISVIHAKAAAEIISSREDKVKEKTAFIKTLTADAEGLIGRAKTAEDKSAVQNIYEKLRYSDPVSNDALEGLETKISEKFHALSEAVSESSGAVLTIAEELSALIDERTNKCKLLK